MRVMLIAGKLDDSATLPLLAPYCDCIVNSANNNLLTPGVTGIAKAIRDLGGAAVQGECDAAKAEHGGDVPVGTAVWTTAGSLGCRKGIAHAITLRYNRGVREPTTPDLVGAAFEAALALADAHDARTLACYVMCAREGYSTVPGAEAPRVMLQAMLSALESAAPADRRVLLFIPSDGDGVPRLLLHGGLPSACARRSVWWCDASIGRKQATLDRLSAAGLDIKFTFDDNETVLADAQASGAPWALITNRTRQPAAGAAADPRGGMGLIASLRARVKGPVILFCGGEPDGASRVEGWVAGANWVTHDLDGLAGLLIASL